jgi:outer membrane protein OmpA-like peptidoglycan-associated protein
MIIRILFVVLVSGLLTACSGTTVVLIPDADGKVGKVSVTTAGGTTLLSKANESSQASKADQPPTQPVRLTDEKIRSMFAETLAKEPAPPERYSLYFLTGTAEISADANAELVKIASAIKARNSCDFSAIGHSDRVGDNESNRALSLQRAETVAKALTNIGVPKQCMDIRYYGENDPAVPTADNVAEARNRRVEVEIR